jgi:uncharacterized protein YndB with AHSA1/START domain
MATEELHPMTREVVVRTTVLPAPIDDVWASLTEPVQLDEWLGEILDLELRAGGRVSVRQPDGSVRRGFVEVVEPPVRLAIRWRRIEGAGTSLDVGVASRVELRLEPLGERTRLDLLDEPVDAVAVGGPR